MKPKLHTPPILEVKDLKKYFPIYSGIFRRKSGDFRAVDGISFSLAVGEILGIVGESGCGKSTAARAAVRLIEPTGGEIYYQGMELLSLSKESMRDLRRQIQMVFQDPFASLNARKTILENIGESLIYHKMVKTRTEQVEAVARILREIGLSTDVLYRYPHQFSGGQQQRISIGRALAMNPRLIICDESVSALDISVQAQILNLLYRLKESFSLSYLFISHDLSVVRHICDRVLVLYFGKVVESASVEELFSNPKHPYTQSLLSAIPKQHPSDRKERVVLKGPPPSLTEPAQGCPFHTRCPKAKPECLKLSPPHQRLKDRKGQLHEYFCIF